MEINPCLAKKGSVLNTLTAENPLLLTTGLPRFDLIQASHIQAAMTQLLESGRTLLEKLASDTAPPDWENFVRPLEDMEATLSRAWSQVGHLNAVMNSPEIREAYNACLPLLTDFYSDFSQDERLYSKYRALHESLDFAALSAARQQVISNELRDFRLGGAELPEAEKARFKAMSETLSKLGTRFEENLLDTTNDFAYVVRDPAQLAGLPEDVIQAAAEAAAPETDAWKFTLHYPSYMPLMQYADDRALRETLYRAYVTRASEFGKPEWDNTALIDEILQLKHEQALLLGYRDHAEVSLASKMAESPTQVMDFLRTLARRAKPYAERDMQELTAFATELGIPELQAWDVAYVSEKLRQAKYAFSEQEVKQYLPEPKVLAGLFKVVETLFGVKVEKTDAPVWHPDASFYSIKTPQGQCIGQFYLDLYARNHKRGGAWMDEVITRRRVDGVLETPVAYLTCNFSAPLAGKPALFTHDEVITLFHEFGHGLHHMLTQVEDYAVSGIKGVEWDAVELPSQFMENFCWEWEVLRHMTQHAETGQELPRALFEKMVAAKNFQAGMQTVRQIELALFDMCLHAEYASTAKTDVLALLQRIRDEVAVVRPPAWNRFANSFSHIFAGGYAAGYYSYKWAEVLSADAYSLFEEHGVLTPEIGQRFWQEILAKGGSRPAMASFVAFRGREPSMDALLRHNGMAA